MKKPGINEEPNPMSKPRKKKRIQKKVHRVYCTYFPDGRYYIGYSCKPRRLYEKYFGSGRLVKEYEGQLVKETIRVFSNRNQAKLLEMLLQLENRHDEDCINDMIHIRLRMSQIKEFEPIEWEPKTYNKVYTSTMILNDENRLVPKSETLTT